MSGNHGRNSQQPPSGELNTIQVTIPQQSAKPFVAPSGFPIKKSPPIADIVDDKIFENKELIPVVTEDKPIISENNDVIIPEQSEDVSAVEDESLSNITQIDEEKEIDLNQFAIVWNQLFEEIFSHIPTIYFPLKGIVPEVKERLIQVKLKNELQKEHFEPKVRDILAYLRTNLNDHFDDINIHVDETYVARKIIYDSADKLKNLSEQNPNFDQFKSILDLKIKE